MGLDLRLLPCEWWLEEHGTLWGFSHTILDLGGVGTDAWEAFQVLVKPHVAPMPVGHRLSSYVGVCLNRRERAMETMVRDSGGEA